MKCSDMPQSKSKTTVILIVWNGFLILGTFENIAKSDFELCYVCPPVQMEQLRFLRTHPYEI